MMKKIKDTYKKYLEKKKKESKKKILEQKKNYSEDVFKTKAQANPMKPNLGKPWHDGIMYRELE